MSPTKTVSPQADRHLQLQKLSLQFFIWISSVPIALSLHLLQEGLHKTGQGSAAATQTILVSYLLLFGVRHRQPGHLLVQGREGQAHCRGLLLIQAKQHYKRDIKMRLLLCTAGGAKHHL